jgi:predicted permease
MFSGLLGDVRRAARTLRRRPGFVAVVALTMGIGVGAVGAVYAVADHLLLRPPVGVHDAEGMTYVTFNSAERPGEGISGLDVIAIRESATLLEGFATYDGFGVRVALPGTRPIDVEALTTHGDYFELLGVRPAAGRLLRSDETGPDAEPLVVVISERLSEDLFGGVTDVVGRRFQADDHELTVLGVAGDGFRGTDRSWPVDLWVPRSAFATLEDYPLDRLWTRASKLNQWFVARPREGVALEAAAAQINAILSGVAESNPETGAYLRGLRASLTPGLMSPFQRDRMRGALAILGVGASMLLLITCANVANLLLVRGVHRRGDVAVSRALGASRGRVTREKLAEGLILAAIGTLAGVGCAWLISSAFRGLTLFGMPEFQGFLLDARALGFAAAAVVITAMLSGTLPAALAARFELSGTLRDAGTQATSRSGFLRNGMSALQIGLSLTLLIGGLLLVRTVRNLYLVDPGIELDGVGAITFGLDRDRPEGAEEHALHQQILEAVRGVPSVRAAALHSGYGPYVGASPARIALPETPDDAEPQTVPVNGVTPGWFELFGVEVVRGRLLRAEDWTPAGPLRVVVTSALAERLFGGLDVVGRTVRIGRPLEDAEIVGVVGDVRLVELDAPPDEGLFQLRPVPGYSHTITVLFRGDALDAQLMASVQAALEAALPNFPVPAAAPLAERIDVRLTEQRLLAQLLALFSTLAVVLAAVGLYGVIAFAVAGRRRELGIRMALGADGRRLRAMVLRSAALIVVFGISAGLIAAAALSRVVESRLFGVEALDPGSYLGAAGILAIVALLACWVPARSAMTTNPVATLRRE